MANDIAAGVNSKLLSDATIRAAVGDRGFIDRLPKICTMPAYYVTLQGGDPAHYMGGRNPLASATVQLVIYAETRRQAGELADAARLALDMQSGTFGNESVRTCQLQESDSDVEEPPETGSDNWRYLSIQEYLVWYVIATS